ncbi:chemotaxis protein CheC [Candidatus Avoscillospira sp. LCP25S3_F1]|uniref:chemotaxis protein CheC n=1 Tax=Candidatus Avoscillospira sp. LCP25S3_F1 TaxID=3438825 RepID=UPI003F8E13E0
MKNYNELNSMELDTLREIGSMGTGNAATALSGMIGRRVRIEMPEVRIMGYNEAIDWIGGPEIITAGVLARMEGEINGIILCIEQAAFVEQVLACVLGRAFHSFDELEEMDISALREVGNIMISAYTNAMSGLTNMKIRPTVPAFAVDMQGAIMAVPMAEFGGQSDYIMAIGTNFIFDDDCTVPCRLLMSPDVRSLNFLLRKLGVLDD